MREIEGASGKISDIIGAIDSIAFQTVEESAAAASALQTQAFELAEAVEQFRTSDVASGGKLRVNI
ncbi:hypothetical protein [Paraburkholderia sp. BL27I4N3]|uniref:hypothetical protein n=1 Tax=Paraburkholderia sp. BL27I4N3 TaxID=1938805 RepID=UPI0011C079AF|nr:hypothetical protein [Paraburkholderia sp. BL27I4N3]